MQPISDIRLPILRASAATAIQHPFLNAIAQLARDIIAGSRDGLALQDRYEALSRLSNRELTRRGLTRADIPRLALIEHRTAMAE
jgi:hypothetical protein